MYFATQIYKSTLLKKKIKILIILFLPAYFYVGYTSIVNKHTHFYPNGIVVTHSHPVDKNSDDDKPFSHHNHSSTQICLFQCASFDKVILPAIITVIYTPVKILSNYRPYITAVLLTPQIIKLSPRSPPS